jgi:hypothetical protein
MPVQRLYHITARQQIGVEFRVQLPLAERDDVVVGQLQIVLKGVARPAAENRRERRNSRGRRCGLQAVGLLIDPVGRRAQPFAPAHRKTLLRFRHTAQQRVRVHQQIRPVEQHQRRCAIQQRRLDNT